MCRYLHGLKGFKNIKQESLKWLAYLIDMLMLRDILKMNSERRDMRICGTIKTRRQLRELQSRVSVLSQVTTNQSDEIIAQHLQLPLAINNNYNISNNFSDHAEAEYKTSINQSASKILHRPQSLNIKKKESLITLLTLCIIPIEKENSVFCRKTWQKPSAAPKMPLEKVKRKVCQSAFSLRKTTLFGVGKWTIVKWNHRYNETVCKEHPGISNTPGPSCSKAD